MAAQNPVQVVEIETGTHIQWEQEGYRLIFGDDELLIRCDTRQKDWPVHVDISLDADGNIGTGVGRYYIAQVDIPAREYEDVYPKTEEGDEGGDVQPEHKPIPLDMGNVILTLWRIDGIM